MAAGDNEGHGAEQRQAPRQQQQQPQKQVGSVDGAPETAAASSAAAAPLAADKEKEAADRVEGQRLVEAMRRDHAANSKHADK